MVKLSASRPCSFEGFSKQRHLCAWYPRPRRHCWGIVSQQCWCFSDDEWFNQELWETMYCSSSGPRYNGESEGTSKPANYYHLSSTLWILLSLKKNHSCHPFGYPNSRRIKQDLVSSQHPSGPRQTGRQNRPQPTPKALDAHLSSSQTEAEKIPSEVCDCWFILIVARVSLIMVDNTGKYARWHVSVSPMR